MTYDLLFVTVEGSPSTRSGLIRGAERALVKWLGRRFAEKRIEFAVAAQCVELVAALRGPGAERAARSLDRSLATDDTALVCNSRGPQSGGTMVRISRLVVSVVVLGLAGAALAVGTAVGGNSDNAKLCQKDGWKTVYRADGATFRNQGDCVSYAAKGGVPTAATLTASGPSACPSSEDFAGFATCIYVQGFGLAPGAFVGFVAVGGGFGTSGAELANAVPDANGVLALQVFMAASCFTVVNVALYSTTAQNTPILSNELHSGSTC